MTGLNSKSTKARTGDARRLRSVGRADAARMKALQAAGVETDRRTAAGNREVAISNVRGIGTKIAALGDYARLIKRTSDRTDARLVAMQRYDELWHLANLGQIPNPKFERGVDVSRSPASIDDTRMAGVSELSRVGAYIGNEAQARLFWHLITGQSLAWMEQQGMGSADRLGVLFLADVDSLARFYGLVGRSRAEMLMESRLTWF